MIFVIDDDEIMAFCIAKAANCECKIFPDAIVAMDAISEGTIPDLIFLDILLDGPDGFAFLNELISYDDTAKIPVVVVSSLDFDGRDLSGYNVAGILKKDSMVPSEIRNYAKKYIK